MYNFLFLVGKFLILTFFVCVVLLAVCSAILFLDLTHCVLCLFAFEETASSRSAGESPSLQSSSDSLINNL